MAKNVTIAGAAFSAVPSIDVPQTGGGTASFFDVSGTTATASDVAQGKVFYAADGTETAGTASGGGGTSFTLLHSEIITTSTTSTSAATVKTITGLDYDKFDGNYVIYTRIRDTAGPRAGYFYGSDNFFMYPLALVSYGNMSQGGRVITRVTTNGNYACYVGATTTGYGVYTSTLSVTTSTARVSIAKRYNASYSLTVDGSYSVDIFAISAPDNVPYFEPLE